MSAHEKEYPDPLSRWTNPTSLERDGLRVKYPGFLLHIPDLKTRRRVLGTDQFHKSFRFPSDRKLLEWYSAELIDTEHSGKFLDTIVNDKKIRLAIILSIPQPQDSPAEIGLLVGIYRELSRKFYCHIIHRLKVWRDTSLNHPSEPGAIRIESKIPEDTCIGQAVHVDQAWIVDGYGSEREESHEAQSANSFPDDRRPPLARSKTTFWDMFGQRPGRRKNDSALRQHSTD